MPEIYLQENINLDITIRKFCIEQTSYIKDVTKRIDKADHLFCWIMTGDKDVTSFKRMPT